MKEIVAHWVGALLTLAILASGLVVGGYVQAHEQTAQKIACAEAGGSFSVDGGNDIVCTLP